jgi:twinkle protein
LSRIIGHEPCSFCGSKDNRTVYEDSTSYCFSVGCSKPYGKGNSMEEDEDLDALFESAGTSKPKASDSTNRTWLVDKVTNEFVSAADPKRRIPKEVYEFYGVKVGYDSSGNVNEKYYPYDFVEGKPQGYKIRVMPKDFKSKGSIGKVSTLFGLDKFTGGLKLVITEGEEDTCAVQAACLAKYKRFYPVISLRSATGIKDLVEAREEIRKYGEVIIWMDNDKAGNLAVPEIARIIGFDKVKIVKSSEKDASDLWVKDKKSVMEAVWNSVDYTPAGILTKEGLWEQLQAYNKLESVPYPPFMSGLNEKLKGMRFGEITLWTSGTGSGKSTILREIVLHLLETTNDKIGILSLEESPAETTRKFVGMSIFKNPAEEELTDVELKTGFDKVFGDDRVMLLDHHGTAANSSVIDHLEFMALRGVKYLFLDHITLLVAEGTDGLTGNEATDKVMGELLRVVKKHDIWLGLISQLRKSQDSRGKSFEEGKLPSLDDIRGSGSIKQISMDVIAFARNAGSPDEEVRNTIITKVLKCRYTGLTGPSGNLNYDYDTGRMTSSNLDTSDFDEEEKVEF